MLRTGMSASSRIGAPSAVGGVHLRGHGTEPVRVHEMLVLPRRGLFLGHLAPGDHEHARRAVEHVPADVHIAELVVVADPLRGQEVLRQDRRPPQPDVVLRCLVRLQVLTGHDRLVAGLWRRLDVLRNDVERALRALDVVFDVGLLALELLRRHAEPLHERRVRGAEQHRDGAEHDHGDDRQRPPLPPDVREEEHRADHRRDDQEVERGQLRVHVGVRRALHHATTRGQQVDSDRGSTPTP